MSELIRAVGDDNVKFQNLFESMKNASTNKKGVTTISFCTDAVSTTELMDLAKAPYRALVLWLPADKVAAVLAAAKKAHPEMTYEQALKVVDGLTLADLRRLMDDPNTDPARLAELDQACGVFNRHIDDGKRSRPQDRTQALINEAESDV